MNPPFIQPYLFFQGRCDEAIAFYQSALGAEVVMLMRYADSPEPAPPGMLPEGWGNKVMHATIRVGQAIVMMSDGCAEEKAAYSGFSLSLSLADEAAARQAFDALAHGGEVRMPLTKTFWSPAFGMLTDRFGIEWMIGVHSPLP